MYSSILLSALVGISSVLAVNFGGRDLPGCVDACYKTVLGQPGLSKCDNKALCLCDDYAILGAIQDCLNRTNDCGNDRDRTDTIYDIQEVCDTVILEAALPTTSASTSANQNQPAPTELPEPTSLQEAEGRLGASASALINEQPYRLSTGAKAGIAVGSIVGFFIIALLGICCGCYHYKSHVIKKFNKGVQNSPAMPYPVEHNDDKKGGHNSWFAAGGGLNIKTHIRGATNDSHELGYGFDKELGLMISAPSNPRKYTTTKIQTVDIPETEHTIPRAPAPAVFPHRNPVSPPPHSPARSMSLGSVQAAHRPSLTLSPSSAVFPQATIEEYTPRNSFRVSVQSQQKGQLGPHINIPLMFFTPATPQVNNASPTSPTSQNGDIYGYYSRDSTGPDNGIGVAQSSIDERTTSPTPYDPTNNDFNFARTPSPYTVDASQASPYNSYASRSPEPRNPTPGFDISTDASSRVSSPSPSRPAGVGLHMPPRYTPYTSNGAISTTPPPPVPTSQDQTQGPEMVDMSAAPVTINRANSNAWRLSVERAADRAMDKVRTAASAATASTPSGFAQVPEEEERLTKSDLANTIDNDSRGRRKKRNQSQGTIAYGSSNTTPTKGDAKSRSGSIGASRSPSGRRTSSGAGGYARRSSSLGGYRNRHNSLSYNQIDGVPRPPRRNSRRGSNSSSVMMI
ncbi:hypothetical protein TWF173_001596 [Orbilia oligospora]|uniref:Extracellular membrane protein CFEM domain-containing protein n=2 Tax=Orbilia oligospora TaxID=2813651 RepID=G1XNU9_ARTOA|nr:hypothetical protein AOL_s00173g117 [Orbilia oligospora ATCC 24927]EGX45016.1 hypothetical protein AOL_s00173g117 [Orbilia oligospora ATCC 24927]KAF3286718.1 hypothetical protein TWF970_008563 [Orbilia oligospora]KAF3308228.1 hypothetical protein TWF173_001596 [Orbilia oligospora]